MENKLFLLFKTIPMYTIEANFLGYYFLFLFIVEEKELI